MIFISIIGLIFVFYLLAKICDQYFVESLDMIANKLRLSEDVTGATFMAIGSSAPELFTAIIALTKVGAEEVGAGTIVGSAIFNVLVIVGASAVVATAYLKWKPVIRDLLFYIFAILILLFTFQDGSITLSESFLYIVGYIFYLVLLRKWSHWFPISLDKNELMEIHDYFEEKEEKRTILHRGIFSRFTYFIEWVLKKLFPNLNKNPEKYLVSFFTSIVCIAVLSWILVELAVYTADTLHIPKVIIALTILAGGTSVPDLLSSMIVARKGRGDMAVSNAVGSNTFDIFVGLGVPWFVYILLTGNSIVVGTENLLASIFLLFFTVIALLFLLILQKFKIGSKSGYILLLLYGGYILYAIISAYL